jgi:phosphoglycerate dehydrogenase-like enzyme
MKKILIVISDFERGHFFPDGLETWIESIPHECCFCDTADADGFVRTLNEYKPQIILGGWDMPPIPIETLVTQGGSLEYCCYLAGSVRKQITEEHIEAGLVITNWGPWVGPYVAECALLLVLSALRRVAKWNYRLKVEGKWRDREVDNRSLYGKRVGIHGYGSVPRALTKLLQPFDPVISTWDPWVTDDVLSANNVQRASSLEALYAESDILVNLLPLTEQTERCVNEELLRSIPEGACFVNIGRGKVVDEPALIEVAREGKIQIALDVYAQEPLPEDSPLRTLSNVFLMPHMGGATIDRGIDCGQRALRNVERFMAGESLENQINLRTYQLAT